MPKSTPPHNTEAEISVLGAMIANPDAITSAISILGDDPGMFYHTAHQHTYSAILDLYRDGDPVDVVTVCNHLTEQGRIVEVGGITYISSLHDKTPTSHNALHYAKIVQTHARRRAVATILERAAREVIAEAAAPDEIIQRVVESSRTGSIERFNVTSIVDWKSIAAQPIDSVFNEGLPIGKLGVLTAEGGTGKSFLALELALSVAMGRTIVKGFTPTAEGRVLCCFGEDDDHVVSRRLEAISESLMIGEEHITGALRFGKLSFLNCQSAALLKVDTFGGITRSAAFLDLLERCKREQYRLVIIDPLVSWAGIANENDNAAMQAVALALIDIATASNGAVLVLHHANKASKRQGDMAQTSARGASSLLDAARWVMSMRTLTDKDISKYKNIDEETAHLYVEVLITKNSYAPRVGLPTTLRRTAGGALRPVDLSVGIADEIARAMVTLMEKMEGGGGLTYRQLTRGLGERAKQFREDLSQIMTFHCGRVLVEAAIDEGIKAGYFEKRLGTPNGTGKPREEVFVCEF